MSTYRRVLVSAFAVLALAACGESPTAPTAPLPNSPAEPWSGSSGVLWSHRGAPGIMAPGADRPIAARDATQEGGAAGR